jgi:hypothetical protein
MWGASDGVPEFSNDCLHRRKIEINGIADVGFQSGD